ncbi:overproduction-induced pheromone-resistant [Diaporthe australafricana]|uniref:Overproduction-induced pheromone-resistant n=1 Tax=Diaporthe australafricana TaxID=127596 RepID=A0ABR3WMK4_9PEZI
MHFQAALSAAVFSASAFADVLLPRQNSCVMCTEVMPTCPVCPASQQCFISDPADCTECPEAYCADNAADATPTPTGIIGGSSSSTSDGGFTLPTVSESETSTTVSSTTTTAAGSGSTTASDASSTGATGASGSASASAPGASSSAPSSAAARNADVSGMLGFALLITVPILGLQRLW